jgi:putative membrane protein
MEKKLIKWIINTVAMLLAIHFIAGINYTGKWWGVLIVAAIFGLVNSFIRPLIKFFTFPLIILSLGLFTFIINAMMLSITSSLSETFGLGFAVEGFKAAFWGALLISLISTVLNCMLPPKEEPSS